MKRVKSFSKRMTAVILSALMVASMFTGCSFFNDRTSGKEKEEKPTQQEQNADSDNKTPNSDNKTENTTPSTNNGSQSGSTSGNNQNSSQSGGSTSGNNQSGSQSGGSTSGNNQSGSQSGSSTSGNNQSGSQSGSSTSGNNQSGSQSGGSTSGNNQSGSQSGSSSSGNNQSGNQSGGNNTTPATNPSLEVVQQADADYEEWLAAAMLLGVSMEYPDFKFNGLYTSTETSLESKENSDGVYILFESNGKQMAVHSTALESERTKAGTKDISSNNLGYATFDTVDPRTVKTGSMTKLEVEDLKELIDQTLLVSVYTH